MHDQLLSHQGALTIDDLIRYAADIGLNPQRFADDLDRHVGSARIAEDVDSADISGVSGTPTFFINGRRHYGAYDLGELTDAVRAARARVTIRQAKPAKR
jgi:protein-disulfide isomerase